ncbi:hypothetical protein BJF85_24945 [Saccharomonospora sp. CUA-673]|uniref:DUF4097 family beta strand repeat-containing protein n=1 Tax=Saccharomonospora sp. CUA-673 TaxID=1904969 RepID=UPI00095AB107|nr:DUF4097 family beta strand repeat-containing protein [Saccharomonospora sp. CUA-673]OLT40373.1 hypothetical protein BJF85_24945 [Saccharomonospora sp. CUA-673]
MPTYDTPGPISVTVDIGATGTVRFIASDRVDTSADIGPVDAADESDVDAARQVDVELSGGQLRISGPKGYLDFSRRSRRVDVTVELPSGSDVTGKVPAGNLDCQGRFGAVQWKTGAGNMRVEQAAQLRLQTGAGHLNVDDVDDTADIRTGSGQVSVGRAGGTLDVKSSNGDIDVDEAVGHARLRTANGAIRVDRAESDVDVRSANGPIRIGELVRGATTLGTSMGDLEIGVAEGTAAWVDMTTSFGTLTNTLSGAPRPDGADNTVEVRGTTSYGDITIRRA